MEFVDDYEHVDPETTYIPESMKTAEVENQITEEFSGCDCSTECSVENDCVCLSRSGAKYTYFDKENFESYVIQMLHQNKPVYECNNNCKCKETVCGNKLVQMGPRKYLKITDTKTCGVDKGFGLTTTLEIDKGNFICEYAGEVVTETEAQKRFKMYKTMNLNNNYIFCINENFGEGNMKTFIDPTFYGNIGRYINHSCQPNCTLVPVRIDDVVPKLCIFAKETIEEKQEITFDYGEISTDNDPSGDNRKKCLCLSQICRKYLPFDSTI